MNPYIIRKPVITEKSLARVASDNIYTFEVAMSATKHQVAAAVAELFKVTVVDIRTQVRKPADRRTGKRRARVSQASYKRALVTLKKGDKIEYFDTTTA